MNGEQIKNLIEEGGFPCNCTTPQLFETHISWVVLCDEYAFKIKKPVHYDFLDFSTLEKRKKQCENEVVLNRRLAKDIYLGVVNIVKKENQLSIDNGETWHSDEIIDYAVRMRKLPIDQRMDLLLEKGKVKALDIHHIVDQLVQFHTLARVIKTGRFESQRQRFNDLKNVNLKNHDREVDISGRIKKSIEMSDAFLDKHIKLFSQREREGFTRDVHGDLHSRNIFLLEQPVIFDCLEFNDQFRQTDILDELAFFCMDMDAYGHPELGEIFLNAYNASFEVCRTKEEMDLFVYYKAYRANVRTKVNLLRAQDTKNSEKENALQGAYKYLRLVEGYLNSIVL